jgi:hypothetical protein
MVFGQETGTALLLVALTVWLQCGGIAALIVWVRSAVPADMFRRRLRTACIRPL